MPLDYRDGQWELDGEPVTPEQIAELRDDLVDQYADELGQIAIDELGITPDEPSAEHHVSEAVATAFVLAFMLRVSDMLTTAYAVARGGVAAVPDAEWRAVVDLVVRQNDYASGFGAALTAGTVSSAQAVARARLYAGSAIEAFSMGFAAQMGFDAPAHPTQGCKGGGNCRCYWSIVAFPDRFEATWRAVGDSESCEVCRQRARDWAPYIEQRTPEA